jgi:hypothetical protein
MAAAELDCQLADIERRLETLRRALAAGDADHVQAEAVALQVALAATVGPLRRLASAGALTPVLRQRLAGARARVAAQRDALARRGAAIERALDVLLPGSAPRAGYAASGHAGRHAAAGSVQA